MYEQALHIITKRACSPNHHTLQEWWKRSNSFMLQTCANSPRCRSDKRAVYAAPDPMSLNCYRLFLVKLNIVKKRLISFQFCLQDQWGII